MNNRIMTVYNCNGSRYFHTDCVAPADETREENFWTAMGYVVVFTESAAAQVPSSTRAGGELAEQTASHAAPAADPAPEYWDTP